MQESGLTEIIPLMCTSAIWGLHPVFSYPEFPQGSPAHHQLWLQSLMTDILCLLIRQAIFHLSAGSMGGQCCKTTQRHGDSKKRRKSTKEGKGEHLNQGRGSADVVSTRDAQYNVPGVTVEESVKNDPRTELFLLPWPTAQFYQMGQRW